MKIISYNICQSSQEKLEKVIASKADIYILPELANSSRLIFPNNYQAQWMGDNDRKGLGVVWKSELNSKLPKWFNPNHKFIIPLLFGEMLVVAAWPTKTESNKGKSYPRILMEALEEYAPFLKQQPTIISGDLNCFMGQQEATKRFSIETICNFLNSLGFVSAYHQTTRETIGKESVATYYHNFNKNRPFFLDYTFLNFPYKSYYLGEWNEEISDHVPQYLEF